MKKYGLIGYPLSHSFSPSYFKDKFIKEGISFSRYDLYPLERLEQFWELPLDEISGLNVTIPYKEKIIPYLDELSEEADKIGAVNTIAFREGRTVGYNTDVFGFQESLLTLIGDAALKALVLGTGGAAKAVCYVLDRLDIQYLMISRGNKGDMTYDELKKHHIEDHHLIINTTPLGMHPRIEECPDIPYKYLTYKHFLYDLVYNPEKTLFLNCGLNNHAKIMNGLQMLQLQAEKSWDIWNQ